MWDWAGDRMGDGLDAIGGVDQLDIDQLDLDRLVDEPTPIFDALARASELRAREQFDRDPLDAPLPATPGAAEPDSGVDSASPAAALDVEPTQTGRHRALRAVMSHAAMIRHSGGEA